ncbi:hypothetical protein BDQ17DRAFT_1429369 [Cyathus striatus]|nr:hypothetical protein BDQ17DRAFT_1429369 [Cyathus striatus]
MYRSERPDIYDNLSLQQKFSSNLVLWCVLAKQLVTVAYPTYMGNRIAPANIRQWLRDRLLHWPCFCALAAEDGVSCSCRLVNAMDGNVYAFCQNSPSTCNFFLDISKIYHSATIESDYANLPTKSRKSPNTSTLLTTFLLASWDNQGPPYFKDYCGEHASDFGGAIQSSGTFSMTWGGTSLSTRPLLSRKRLLDEPIKVHRLPDTSLARTRVKRTKTTMDNEDIVKEVAEEKSVWYELMKDDIEQEKMKETFIISDHESDIIARFREGFAVSKYDFEGLIEMSYFLTGALNYHISECKDKLSN